ncbi:MAG: 6-bladed beta-propeller [Arcobacteraceae bacterium]
MYKINKKVITLFVAAIVTILCVSCCGNVSKKKVKESKKVEKAYKYAFMKDGVLHLDLNEARKHPKEVKLSDICDSLIYIPLETKKASLIKSINCIDIDGDDLFIQDGWKLLHFNRSGKFINQIGRTGRGPGEYICVGFSLNKKEKVIYAMANYKRRVMKFSYNGKLLSNKLKFNEHIVRPVYSDKLNSIIGTDIYSLYTSKSKTYNMIKTLNVSNGVINNTKSKYFPDKYFKSDKNIRLSLLGPRPYSYKGYAYFKELGSDTIFKKESEGIRPHIILNNYKFKSAFTSEIYADLIGVDSRKWNLDEKFYSRVTSESSKYVLLLSREPYFIYDKEEKILRGIKLKDKQLLIDDIDAVCDFQKVKVINNKYLFTKMYAEDFIDAVVSPKIGKQSKNKELLDSLVKGMTEESNPILVLARLKK